VGSPKPGLDEDEMVERIRGALGGGIGSLGLRDDAASVEVPDGGSLVVSVDSVVEGVHVDLSVCSPADVGWKALMGALSDLAAMGARPVGALVALCAPRSGDGLALGVMEGVAEAAAVAGCPVVGGDVSQSRELMVSVTVMGTVDGGQPVARSGARAGDVVLVTGPCGGSAAALRELRSAGLGVAGPLGAAYRRPVARLAAGVEARLGGGSAMIDVSDGLALDLHRLADASGVGFRLTTIPVAEGATFEEAVGGGEDYELVMAVAERDLDGLSGRFSRAGLAAPVRLGVITADVGERLLGGVELGRHGWQHQIG
jgi:thiamine-monophosphate kinase